MFQVAFKYYKARNTSPSFKDVLVVGDDNPVLQPVQVVKNSLNQNAKPFPGLFPPEQWKIYAVTSRPGLLVVANPFNGAGQRYWMVRTLLDYPVAPNETNIIKSSDYSVDVQRDVGEPHFNWWQKLQSIADPINRHKFAKTLRWATLGYQYNWTEKVYDESRRITFPVDLDSLVRYVAKVLGYEKFVPQAAIVNYYPIGATLAGHTDHSEDDQMAPLFSFSFGQPAIFLIGGTTREEQPDAILLRSGDIVVMSGPSRQCYHAVPRICTTAELPVGLESGSERWKSEEAMMEEMTQTGMADFMLFNGKYNVDQRVLEEYIRCSRININVRQVLRENQATLNNST